MPTPETLNPDGGRRRERWQLIPADDLLRQPAYLRIWISVLLGSLGGQVTMLALPLTAALLLSATPTQMGVLTMMETLPFVLFSLPAGVWLDRVRKLPVMVAGEIIMGLTVLTVPLVWWLGGREWLTMGWLYGVGFLIGLVNTVAGSASQIVLTQVVGRERLVEAFARNALASSTAEVTGPGLAGLLIKAVGAPMALLVDAVMLLGSAAILRGVPVHDAAAEAVEARRAAGARPDWRQEVHSFGRDLMAGLRFVMGQRLLVQLALQAGLWQFCYHAAMVVQILYATRTLGLSEQAVGLSYVAVGLGSVLGSLSGHRVSQRLGPGPAMLIGQAVTGLGWLAPVLCSPERVGQGGAVAAFVFLLLAFAVGATWIFVNFISLRQVVTPGPLLGRMTTTMRWLILLPAGPGALIGGWLGEHAGLWSALAFAGGTVLLGVAIAWRYGAVRQVMVLPQLADELADSHQVLLGAEAAPGHIPPPADGGQSMSATVPRPPGPAHGAAVSAAPAAPFSGPAA